MQIIASTRVVATSSRSRRRHGESLLPRDGFEKHYLATRRSGIVTQDTNWVELTNAVSDDATGITGQVLRGPIVPGPEVPGQINEEPFSALFSVPNSENNTVVRFESDDNGIFTVLLLSGEYTIVPDASAPILFPEQQTKLVIVPEDGFADVILMFDTGIR